MSLFALIFSIGILVDDAIVVVENIHRHQQLSLPLVEVIPGAVDEVEVHHPGDADGDRALLPMAFVSGLMGPYMSPIPINASMGMLISLAIAFVVTPWLSRLWLKASQAGRGRREAARPRSKAGSRVRPHFPAAARRRPRQAQPPAAGNGVAVLIAVSSCCRRSASCSSRCCRRSTTSPSSRSSSTCPQARRWSTAAVLHEPGNHSATLPEVTDYQAYAPAPRSTSTAWCANITCAPVARSATSR